MNSNSFNIPSASIPSNSLAIDAKSLDSLKNAASQNSPEAIKAAAKQFEAVLTNMMLKGMREATPQDSFMDNDQSRMFTSMLDQQLSTHLSQKGLGLADVLAKQLSASTQTPPAEALSTEQLNNTIKPTQPTTGGNALISNTLTPHSFQQLQALSQAVSNDTEAPTPSLNAFLANAQSKLARISQPSSVFATSSKPAFPDQPVADTPVLSDTPMLSDAPPFNVSSELGRKAQQFVETMGAHAHEASLSSGIPARFMLGQAGLETGWGQKPIKTADGENSHNLFGIKAGKSWKGKVALSTTTEYIQGVKQTRYEPFRAYDSYADAFKDYASLISDNPRYQGAMANTHDAKAYANALQEAGYATDPQYAKKLSQVIAKISS